MTYSSPVNQINIILGIHFVADRESHGSNQAERAFEQAGEVDGGLGHLQRSPQGRKHLRPISLAPPGGQSCQSSVKSDRQLRLRLRSRSRSRGRLEPKPLRSDDQLHQLGLEGRVAPIH